MATALPGTNPQGGPRIRILLAICELQQAAAPATYRELQRRLELSSGSMSHHLRELEREGLVTRAGTTRAFALTDTAISDLMRAGWLVARHAITVVLSTMAVELLELAPEPDDTSSAAEAPSSYETDVPDDSVGEGEP